MTIHTTEITVVRIYAPGFFAIFSEDPNGYVLKLTVPSKVTNDCEGTGICVPARRKTS